MAQTANHTFLPWVQPADAAAVLGQVTDTLAAGQRSVITAAVQVTVNAETVTKTVRLYGPGDVTGFDPQQVVRLEPRPRTTNMEPNYFPAIEFDRPDFPWLFTPARAGAQERLRPWICLVVVRVQPGVEFRPGGGQALPVLDIHDPASPGVELPDLSESHLWAHTQLTAADPAQLKATLENAPEKSVSRLLSPRRLDPLTDYIACVVPAFAVGVMAGMGQPILPADEGELDPAWGSGDQAPAAIILPVYYSWEFRTGAGGDFEELARQLKPYKLPDTAGKRPMDISSPGFKVQPPLQRGTAGTTLGLEGALRIVDAESDAWLDATRVPFQTALQKILNLPWQLANRPGTARDPVVAPPIYGSWQSGNPQVGTAAAPPAPGWLNDLNLDPRSRVAAAMGTQVVQNQQEQLMASAWEQLGNIQAINQRLRQAQLSRAVNNVYHANAFSRFSDESFFRVVAPAQSRLVVSLATPDQPGVAPEKVLLVQKLAESPVPRSAVSAPLRRIARPRGAINRQFAQAGTGAGGIRNVFNLFNSGLFQIFFGPFTPAEGPVTIDQVSAAVSDTVLRLANLGSSGLNPIQPTELFDAAKAHQAYLEGLFTTTIASAPRPPIGTSDLMAAALESLDPNTTVPQAVLAGMAIGSPPLQTGDPLEPIMDAPAFPQPMYEELRDLSQDNLFPGLDQVPPNTVQTLQTNPKFVEAFMVGLNAAMGSELLWRGYPTDQRGTYFRRFWAAADPNAAADIPPIPQWGDVALGKNATGAGASGDQLVLVVRSDLLLRYPNAVVYAVKAVMHGSSRDLSTNPADESHPLFRGTLPPDITFLGFNLTHDQALSGAGYYFVLQQQPTEPRFGMDLPTYDQGGTGAIPELKTWDDLNWAHLAPNAEALRQISYVSAKKVNLTPTQPVKGTWGRNSAHMAYITKQQPVRVAIHATQLLS